MESKKEKGLGNKLLTLSSILWIFFGAIILYFHDIDEIILTWVITTTILFIAMIGLDIKYKEKEEQNGH